MKASIGDHIVVRGHHVGEAGRTGEVIEVRGAGGQPPYMVRWSDGHEGLCFPGPDAVIEQSKAAPAAPRDRRR